MEAEVARIRDLLKDHPKGMTIEEISRLLPLNRTSTAKYLNTLLISGQAEMRTYGRAKVFSLTQRVPMSRLMSLSSDLILILDRERNVTYVNDGFLEFLGIERKDLVGKKIDQIPVSFHLAPETVGTIGVAMEGDESVGEQHIQIRGRDYFFIIKMIPMVFDEGSGGLAIILEDITEIKKYQLHLERLVDERTREIIATNEHLEREIDDHRKARDALEVVNKKLNLLASVTRHDILNQITAISGYIQLLNDELASDPKTLHYIQSVERAISTIQRQITFTRDYKDLGVRPAEWQRVHQVIQRAAGIRPLKEITLESNTGTLEIFADPFLEKVFVNIFDHAIRHSDRISTIKVSFREHAQKGTLVIEDDGAGVPAAKKEHLFDYSSGKDSGFGLFLSREILSITGVSIRESGTEGRGDRFEIDLPKGSWRTGNSV
jgi:PAS domain S-box-containing protein